MDKHVQMFLENDKIAKQMYETGLPVKKFKKKKKHRTSRFFHKKTSPKLNKSVGPLSTSRTESQRQINKRYTDMLMWSNRDKYLELKKNKFNEDKFETWRSQNLIRQEELKLNLTKKKEQIEK
jgi:hypothetical protein